MMITSLDNNRSGLIGWVLSYCGADKMTEMGFFPEVYCYETCLTKDNTNLSFNYFGCGPFASTRQLSLLPLP